VIKKVHINMCPILDGYGVTGIFLFPYMPSCEPREQLAGDVLYSVAYRLQALFSQLTRRPSYRQSSSSISTLGRYLRNVGWVGGYWAGQCIPQDSAIATCSETLIAHITVTVQAPDVQNSTAIVP
jgi:hypothetical protein